MVSTTSHVQIVPAIIEEYVHIIVPGINRLNKGGNIWCYFRYKGLWVLIGLLLLIVTLERSFQDFWEPHKHKYKDNYYLYFW